MTSKSYPAQHPFIMKIFKASVIVLLLIIGQSAFAQEKSYKETVTENPTADEDIKVVSDYLTAVMGNQITDAGNLLADDYVSRGPAYQETETKEEHLASWTEANEGRTKQKNDFVSNTFRVIDGDQKGDWVSIWGLYTFTQNEVEINLSYQYTAMIEDGKISSSIVYYDNLAVYKEMGYELIAKKK